MIKEIGEIFSEIRSAETAAEKIDLFGQFKHRVAVIEVLKIAAGIDPFIPEINRGSIEYLASGLPYPYNESRLMTAYRGFNLFRNTRLDPERVKIRFVQFLEGLHAKEASLLMDAVDRDLHLGISIEEALLAVGIEPPKVSIAAVEEPEAEEASVAEETPPVEKKTRKSRKKTVEE